MKCTEASGCNQRSTQKCLCFLCSYEGTGRSLSLKLIQQLRQQSTDSQLNLSAENRNTNTARLAAGSHHLRPLISPLPLQAEFSLTVSCCRLLLCAARTLHEVSLHESIRYGAGDAVEKWLNELLCLDCLNIPRLISGCPLPQACDLYPSFPTN